MTFLERTFKNMFTPQQLSEITIGKVKFGGYNPADVDNILVPLIEDYTKLYQENSLLKSARLASKAHQVAPAPAPAPILSAPVVPDTEAMIAEARKAGEAIVAEARKTAGTIIQEAQAKAAAIMAEAEAARAKSSSVIGGNAPVDEIIRVQAQMQACLQALEELKLKTLEAGKPVLTGKGSVDRPWMKFYPEGIDKMMAIPDMNLYEYMKMMCRGGNLPVIHYYGTDITWDEYFQMVDATARAMRAVGLREGDQIPVLLAAVPEFLVILLAAEKIGASLLCRDNTIAENAEAISKAGARIMFAHDFISGEAVRAYTAAGIEKIILVNPWRMAVKAQMPQHIINCLRSCYTEPIFSGEAVCKWEDFIATSRIYIGQVDAPKDANRPLFRAYTSGSTGPSKQVIHSARTMLGVIHQMSGYGNSDDFRPTWLTTILPPALIAVTVSMMLVPMCSNRLLILDPFVDVNDLDLELMRYKPNAWPLIPMFMEILMKSKRIPADYDMSHMLACGAGAEATNNGQIRHAQKFLHDHNCHVTFSTSYGQSEACSNITFPAPGYEFGNGNVGIPMPLNVMGIFRGVNECNYNQKGEVCITGPGIMLGYDNEEATSKTLIRHDDGLLWLHTGDTGYMNEDGVVFVLGRSMAKRYNPENPEKSKRIAEIALENQVCDANIHGLADAFFVITADHNHPGYQVPYLYVVLDDGFTIEDIRSKVNDALEEYQRPVEIIQIPERPFYHFKTNRLHLDAPYARN